MQKRALSPILILVVLAAAAVWIIFTRADSQQISAALNPAPQAGFPAPDFTLQTTDGQTITLSDLRGQAVLINIWASWCPPCRAEMPAMQRVYEKYSAQGFTILAVNAILQDDEQKALDFVREMGLTFPVLFEYGGEVSSLYDAQALPSSYFIDPQGIIQEVVFGGPMAEALLETRIQKLLAGAKD